VLSNGKATAVAGKLVGVGETSVMKAPKVKKDDPEPINDVEALEVTTAELAQLFNLTPQRINQLVTDGVLEKLGRNRFNLAAAFRQYTIYLLLDRPRA
jgi:hypothetical protein